jgi:hypothetical protein
MIEAGERAPHFSLLAAGSGKRISLEGAAGRKLVLIFHLQGTAPTAREINRAVRARHPSPEDVLIASVIDLSMVPPVYWMTVGLVLNSAYERATKEELPPEIAAEDYVIICPDWGGFVSRKYQARKTGRAAAIVVVDEDSNIAGSYQGERPVEAVLGMLVAKPG